MSKPEKQRLQRGFPDADPTICFIAIKHETYGCQSLSHVPFDDDEVSTDGSHQFLQADKTVVGVPAPLDFED